MDVDEKNLVDLNHFWDSEEVSERNYCDCPGPPPPPQFLLPPPPPPPSLDLCRNGAVGDQSDLQFCHLEPVGAEYTQASFPSLPIIVVCSSVVLVAILVASYLLWKHKKKVQNFLPCKSEPHQAHHCDMTGSNGVTYDDVLINRHPTRLPNHHHAQDTRHGLTPIELLDVKYGSYGPGQLAPLSHTNFTFTPNHKESGHHHQGHHHHVRASKNKDHFNPIYEEVSGCSEEKPTSRSYDSDIEDSEAEARTVASEDEFAEDELSLAEFPRPATGTGTRPCSGTSSLQGSTGGDLCRDVGSVSSEGAGSEGGHSENRGELRGLFRGPRGGGVNGTKGRGLHQPKHTHSLERNKDGHPSEGFLAKQNYYMSKSMLGPDLAGGMGSPGPMSKTGSVGNPYQDDGGLGQHSFGHSMGRLTGGNGPESGRFHPISSNQLGSENNTRSPFASNARKDNYKMRLPGGLLSELNHKLVGNGGNAVPNRTLPSPGVPAGTRSGSAAATPVFTVDPDEPYPPPSMGGSRGVTGRGVSDFSTFHPYPPPNRVANGGGSGNPVNGGGLPSPPPPATENIYASVEEDGPFTIDGNAGRSRGGSFSANASRQNGGAGGDFKTPPAPPPSTANRLMGGGTSAAPNTNSSSSQGGPKTIVPKDGVHGQKGHLVGNQRTPAGGANDDESASYGDIMPIYDTRTVCT